jgi:predicted DNA-binding protein
LGDLVAAGDHRRMRTVFQLRLSPYEKRRLEALARENQRTIADLIREALNDLAADSSDDPPIFKLRKN